MTGRIAVTPRSLSTGGHPALQPLVERGYEVVFPAPGRQPTRAEQDAVLPGCVGYLAGVEPVPGELLRACPELRVVSRNGVGVDNVDTVTAAELGIAVERAEGANAEGVAELAMALILACIRSVPMSDAALKAGNWERRRGVELRGRTLGVVGTGQIGRRVAELGLGFGMRVLAHDLAPSPELAARDEVEYADLEAVVSGSDVVSLHCPPGESPIIDAVALAGFRRGSYLVNTARAGLVDEAAVEAALDAGILAGFATDVFAAEPPARLSLLARPDVVATPHVGGFTDESVERATRSAVEGILRVLDSAG
ncbi:MAG: phosphoglycerate dehydrogenase [Candidatus Nanopelagicales bacterium]